MEMWWKDRSTVEAVVDDLEGSVGTALFALHSAGRQALGRAASDPFGSRRNLDAVLQGIADDAVIGPVCKAFDDASGIAGYGAARVAGIKSQADRGAVEVVNRAIKDGVPWAGAAARAAAVYGVPGADAARAAARLVHESYEPVADRELILWAYRTERAEDEHIAKNMVTTHVVDGVRVEVVRDDAGRFADKESKRAQRTNEYMQRERTRRGSAPVATARNTPGTARTAAPAPEQQDGETREERIARIRRKRARGAAAAGQRAEAGRAAAEYAATQAGDAEAANLLHESAAALHTAAGGAVQQAREASGMAHGNKAPAAQAHRATTADRSPARDTSGAASGGAAGAKAGAGLAASPAPATMTVAVHRVAVPMHDGLMRSLPSPVLVMEDGRPAPDAHAVAYSMYTGTDQIGARAHDDAIVAATNAARTLFTKFDGDIGAVLMNYEYARMKPYATEYAFMGRNVTMDEHNLLRSLDPTSTKGARGGNPPTLLDKSYSAVAHGYIAAGGRTKGVRATGDPATLAGGLAAAVQSEQDALFQRVAMRTLVDAAGGRRALYEGLTNGRSTEESRALSRGARLAAIQAALGTRTDYTLAPYVVWQVKVRDRAGDFVGEFEISSAMTQQRKEAMFSQFFTNNRDALGGGAKVEIGGGTIQRTLPTFRSSERTNYILAMAERPVDVGTGPAEAGVEIASYGAAYTPQETMDPSTAKVR